MTTLLQQHAVISKSHITYRISPELWLGDADFEKLCHGLQEVRSGYDDLALFSSFTHSVFDLSEMQRRCRILKKRIAVLREQKLGDKIGVNLLTTMGHHAENFPMIPKNQSWTKLTGISGDTVEGCFCCADVKYREEYLKPLFTALTESGIDFLWLDDDLRFLGHGALSLVCFCDQCMAEFNAEQHTNYTRETLNDAFHHAPLAERLSLRQSWLAFSGRHLTELFQFAADCVQQLNPKVQMGGMDGGMRVGDSASYDALLAALGEGKADVPAPRWRPGGGAYTDFQMLNEMVLYKVIQMGSEADTMPQSCCAMEAEIESFNYQRLRKSCHGTAFEAALYCAGGVTGTAWNILSGNDFFERNLPIMRYLAQRRSLLDRIVVANQRLPQRGVCLLWKRGQGALSHLEEGNWMEGASGCANALTFSELFAAGVPMAMIPEAADAFALTGNTAYDYSDAELKEIFRHGVYCDVATLKILAERNLSELTGFRVGKQIFDDGVEVLKAHSLNGEATGMHRDCRQSFARFWGDDGGVFALEAVDDSVEILSELQDYTGEVLADCVMGVCRNALGGKVVVSGYYPITNQLFEFKLAQMKRIFNFLSNGNALSAYVASYHMVKIFVRNDAATGRTIIELANASLDAAQSVEVVVAKSYTRMKTTARLLSFDGKECEVEGKLEADGTIHFMLDELAPWSVNLLEY